jgi:hypothetical protein
MRRRRRIKRWILSWRRLLAFGKMLQQLHEEGYTLVTWAAAGAQVRVMRNSAEARPAPDSHHDHVHVSGVQYETATVTPISAAKSAFEAENVSKLEVDENLSKLDMDKPMFEPPRLEPS